MEEMYVELKPANTSAFINELNRAFEKVRSEQQSGFLGLFGTIIESIDSSFGNLFSQLIGGANKQARQLYEQTPEWYRITPEGGLIPIPETGKGETVKGGGGVMAGGMAGGIAGGIVGIAIELIKKGFEFIKELLQKIVTKIIESSPILSKMLELWNKAINLIWRPIGDFIGMILLPIVVAFYKYLIIPFYRTFYPKLLEYSKKIGEKLAVLLPKIADIILKVTEQLMMVFEKVIDWLLTGGLDIIINILNFIFDGVKVLADSGLLSAGILAGIATLITLSLPILAGIFTILGVILGVMMIISAVIQILAKGWEKVSGGIGAVGGGVWEGFKRVLGFQGGGLVRETGLYPLHRGEIVTAKGNVGNSINITVNIDRVEREVDVDNLANKLARIVQEKTISYTG